MKILEKIAEKAKNPSGAKIPTIAFLGDSVTEGCFELLTKSDGKTETAYDLSCAYHKRIGEMFENMFPNVPINIINAGISGDTAPHGLRRLERDVLCYHPDLTVVCYGLNDAWRGMDGLSDYTNALNGIFSALKAQGGEVIFMTPNMMNTCVSIHSTDEKYFEVAKITMKLQNDGILPEFLAAAKQIAENHDVRICDVYEKWNRMYKHGIDITELLANKLNHPSRQMHFLFTYSLFDTMLDM